MRIGIISDTHDNGRKILESVEIFNREGVSLVVHCGDWDMPFTLRFYKELNCPLRGVLGNGDPDITKFWWINEKEGFHLDLQLDPHLLDFSVNGRRIAVIHGDSPLLLNLLLESKLFDAIFYGHDHIAQTRYVGNVLLVNPGSLVGVYLPNSRCYPYTIAIYDTDSHTAKIMQLP
jgi:putative phosphoesterase